MISCFGLQASELYTAENRGIYSERGSESNRQTRKEGGRGRKESFKNPMEFLGKGRAEEHKLWVDPCDNVDQAPKPSLVEKH